MSGPPEQEGEWSGDIPKGNGLFLREVTMVVIRFHEGWHGGGGGVLDRGDDFPDCLGTTRGIPPADRSIPGDPVSRQGSDMERMLPPMGGPSKAEHRRD